MSLSLIGFAVTCLTPAELSLSYRFPERVRQGGRAVNTNIKAEALGKLSILASLKKEPPVMGVLPGSG
jgi:hypothetical protein